MGTWMYKIQVLIYFNTIRIQQHHFIAIIANYTVFCILLTVLYGWIFLRTF